MRKIMATVGGIIISDFSISIFLLLLCLTITLKSVPFAFDDAYIHFRIAENFANYSLPYYNLSEHVMSTSSFIWTLLLTLLVFIKIPLPVSTAIVEAILLVVGASVWKELLIRLVNHKLSKRQLFFYQITYIGLLLPSAKGLMESPLAVLLLGVSILLIITGKKMGWSFFAIAIFTRYEFILYFLILAGIWTGRDIKKLFSNLLYFLVPFAIISVVLFDFYSTIIPNTIFAKGVVYQLTSSNVFSTIFFSVFPINIYPFLGIFYGLITIQQALFSFLKAVWMPGMLIIFFTALLWYPYRIIIGTKAGLTSLGLILGGIILSLLYTVAKILLFTWYTPLYSIPMGFGIYSLAMELINSKGIYSGKNKYVNPTNCITLLMLVICLIPLSEFGMSVYSSVIDTSFLATPKGLRVQRYLEIGKELYTLFPNASLMTSEIGGLGYSFKGEILDGLGLVTPQALQYHPMKVPQQRSMGALGAIPAKMVADYSPELVVSYPMFVEEFDRQYGNLNYVKITIPAVSRYWRDETDISKITGTPFLYIYVRKDKAISSTIVQLLSDLNQ